jgi:hypothetical protein
LLAGPVFFIIDHVSGLPLWWGLADSLACGLFGASLLWLNIGQRQTATSLNEEKSYARTSGFLQ